MNDPVRQPVRRLGELLIASRDWAEIIIAVNLVFEPLAERLMTNYLIAQQGSLCGDTVTPLIAQPRRASPALDGGDGRAQPLRDRQRRCQ